jgi:hypothetical protein
VGPAYETETHYFRVYVARLRRELEPDPSKPRHLLTEPGMDTASTSTEDQMPRVIQPVFLCRTRPRSINSDDWFEDVERARVARRVDRC